MAEITVKFKCPNCQVQLEAGAKLAGTKGTCPNCGKEITVPEKDTQTQSGKGETAKEK